MPARRNDWPTLRAAYVEGHIIDPQRDPYSRAWPTLEEVSTLHGVAFNTVRRRAAQEGWTTQREEFQAEVERERRRWLIEQRVEQATRVDDRGLSSAEAGLALVGMRLTLILAQQQQLPQPERGRGVDGRELAGLGLAAKRFIDVKAHIMGQPATSPDETLDELERQERVETRSLAADLAAFLAERTAERAAEEQDAAPSH